MGYNIRQRNIAGNPNLWELVNDRTLNVAFRVHDDGTVSRCDAGQPALAVVRMASNVANAETITLGSEIYEFRTSGSPTAGNIAVDVSSGVTPTIASAALVTAINANTTHGYVAYAPTVNEIVIRRSDNAVNTDACSETLAGSNNTIDSAFHDGRAPALGRQQLLSRVPTAQEVAIGSMRFPCLFLPRTAMVQIKTTSTGAVLAWDGAIVIDATNNYVTIDNSGAADWAVTHTVTLTINQ